VAAVPTFVLLILVFWSFGDRLARLLRLRTDDLPVPFALSVTLSLGAVTLLVFLLAVLRIVNTGVCLGLVAVMGLVSFRELRANLRLLVAGIRRLDWRRAIWPGRDWQGWALWLSGLVLLLAAVQSLAPVTGMDTGRMHFTAVKLMLRERGLSPEPEAWFHRTGGFYMIYLLGMAIQGEALAKLLAFAVAPLILLLSYSSAERLKPGTGRIAVAATALTPLFSGFSGYEYLELPVLMYLLAAIFSSLNYDRTESAGWAAAAGGLLGLSIGVKITTFGLLILLPVLGFRALRGRERRGWLAVGAGALLFLVAAGFWPLWNKLTMGSWTFRYLDAILPTNPLAAKEARWLTGMAFALGSLVTTSEYWMDSCGAYLVAALAGVLVFRAPRESRLPALLALGSVGFYFAVLAVRLRYYFWVDAHARYLGPGLVAFGSLAAAPFHSWAQSGPRWLRIALAAALLLPAAPLLVLKAGKAAVAAPAAFGFESRSHYLGKKIETYAACEVLNAMPDPAVKVLFLAQRPYYLEKPMAPNRLLKELQSREDLVRRVREIGVTHVLWEPEYIVEEKWLLDADAVFGKAPFREIGRWPWKRDQFVRLYAVDR
jgi:hypothetical protein